MPLLRSRNLLLAAALGISAFCWADSATGNFGPLNQIFSSADKQRMLESMALVGAIQDSMSEAKDAKTRAKLQETIDTETAYQAAMTRRGEIILKARRYIIMLGKVSAFEIAMHATRNPQYIEFQSKEGKNFDEHHGVPVFESDIQRLVDRGPWGDLSDNPRARIAVIRHQSALRLINNTESLLDDKIFALDFLNRSAMAMTNQQ